MFVARLESQTDFPGWRTLARSLRLSDIEPDQVVWRVGDEGGLFDGDPPPQAPAEAPGFGVSRTFMELAEYVVLHRSPERFDLLYRLLWRMREEPHLLDLMIDPQVAQAVAMRRQVRDAEHKMHAFLRFRLIDGDGRETDRPDTNGPETYVAWFEPPHYVIERGADFFVHRMANLRFSILSPDVCAHWDREALTFTPGVAKTAAPNEDELEDFWRTYFASVFNPARLNAGLMTKQMPKSYWRNLPEASLIPDMVQQAQGRTAVMVQAAPTTPSARTRRRAAAPEAGPAALAAAPASLEVVGAALQACRRCDLWRDATQAVAGEGPRSASMMFVGEQPGDTEDLSGQPFIGPAGQLLDRALAEAGVSRGDCYVTNAVKHFKWEPRGKRRLHKSPAAGEVKACRWWLDAERTLMRPKVIVTLGATAATAVFGRAVSVTKERGAAGELGNGAVGFITVHPSYLLRLPDAATKAAEYDRFVQDLAAAALLARSA